MRYAMRFWVAALAGALGHGHAQSLLDQVSFKTASAGGLRVYGASVFSSYATSVYPAVGGGYAQPGYGYENLKGSAGYGASATLGWQRHRSRYDLSLMYSGGYTGFSEYSELSAPTHSLTAGLSRSLGPKWMLSVSANAGYTTFAQFLFQPSNLNVISQASRSFDDLAAAMSVGQFSSSKVASLLTGAQAFDSPFRSQLLGNRVLTYASQASLSYAHSSRLIFHFGGFAAGGENRDTRSNGVSQQPNYVMPRTMGVNGGFGVSYSLSPRTDIGFGVEAVRTDNRLQAAYTSTASASLGRKMGRRWFLRVYGGGSYSDVVQQSLGAPKARQIVGGGSIGFRTYRHTLMGSYDRSGTGGLGYAAGTTTRVQGSWTWLWPGSGWSFFSSFGQEQARNTGYLSISGWQAGGGASRRLGSQMAMTIQYVHQESAGGYLGALTDLSADSVRVSLNWTPEAGR